MDYSLEQRAELIIDECMKISSTNPYDVFHTIAQKDYVRIHGPEHHVLDGACILTVFHNAGGNIDLCAALQKLMYEGLRMPGAACGLWGVCGAVTSIGAALAIIDETGPLSTKDWGSHMEYTSAALARLAKIGGPRCCKRDAFSAMEQAIEYINKHYDITLDIPPIKCDFSSQNAQCIGKQCPYNGKSMEVTLQLMNVDEKSLLIRLMELYNYEFSLFSNDDINEYGYYGYDHIDDYWNEEGRFPYLIRVDGKIAGFALICPHCNYRKEDDARCIGEFFVMLKYRRMGVGLNVATQLFDKHRGLWEICYWRNNLPASQFWKKVVEKYTNNHYQICGTEYSTQIGYTFEN